MLWFRNLQSYRLAADHGLSPDTIATALEKKPFLPCGSQDLFSQGWVPPASHMPDLYAVSSQGAVLVCLKTEEKLLPAAVVRQQADERIARIEAEEGRKLNREYRKKDYATNVLTFDYQQEPTVMADLVLCAPVVEREAREQNKTLEAHYAHLIVHGMLHLQGYDHETGDDDAQRMEDKERAILASLGFDDPYQDRKE